VGPATTFRPKPMAALGFKAYMTPRAFFRNDLRLVLSDKIDAVIWRFGIGVDF
jgi:hypothetical protein